MADIQLLIGIGGMILILIAFILDLLNKLDDDTKLYNLINIMGAGLLLYYAYVISSFPFMILQIIWLSFASYKLAKLSLSRQHLKKKH